MVFKDFCVFVLWAKVASALERLKVPQRYDICPTACRSGINLEATTKGNNLKEAAKILQISRKIVWIDF